MSWTAASAASALAARASSASRSSPTTRLQHSRAHGAVELAMKRFTPPASPTMPGSSPKRQQTERQAEPRSDGARSAQVGPATSAKAAVSTLASPGLSAQLRTPVFQKPACIATFSYDDDRGLHHDNRSLGVFRDPPGPRHDPNANRGRGQMRGPDLNYGFDRWRRTDENVDEHLDSLVTALQHKGASAATPDADRDRARADVVTWRGIATKLCMALFAESDYDAWELNAMQVGRTIYLEEYVPMSTRKGKAASTEPRLLGFMYQGYAFESFCTSPAVSDQHKGSQRPAASSAARSRDPPGWSGDINNNVQWCAICKTTLGSNRLIIGGEVDCIRPEALSKFASPNDLLHASSLDPDDFVELKTSAEIRGARDLERFEGPKMLRFYFQSFLLGVPRVVTGFRDRDGHLIHVEHLSTLQLPRTVRARHPQLDAGKGLAFADQIMGWIRTRLKSDAPDGVSTLPDRQEAEHSYPVYRISFNPQGSSASSSSSCGQSNNRGGTLAIRRLADQEVAAEIKGDDKTPRVGFLPASYYEFARSKLIGQQTQ